jgi:predicted restriction endonuclease
MPEITSRRAWREAVRRRDHHRCRWCGAVLEICTHHVRETSRWPTLALDLDNGLTLCKAKEYV